MSDPDLPDVLPCDADPDYECVRIGSQGLPRPASPPPGGRADPGPALCPEGYVPRRRRNRTYTSDGKVIHRTWPPERRPEEPER